MASLARVQLSYDEFNGPRVKSYSPTGLGAMSALFMFGMCLVVMVMFGMFLIAMFLFALFVISCFL